MSNSKIVSKREIDKNSLRKYSLDSLSVLNKADRHVIAEIFFKGRKTLLDNLPQREAWSAVETFHLEADEVESERIKNDVIEHDKFIEKKEKELSEAEKELVKKQEELEKAKKDVLEAQAKVDKARTVLKAANSYHSDLQEMVKEKEKILKERKSRISQINSIVLIHKSASIKQVDENQYAYIVVTSSDFDVLSWIQPDQKFEAELAEKFIENLPNNFCQKYSKKEQKSIIDFCEMVVNFQLNSEKERIVPVYANKDISEILRMNGMED